jgi:hypothetical protein
MSAALQPAREKVSAHDAEPRCLGSNHASAGGKKKGAETRCAGRGAPKTLRRLSEIDTGSLALTAQVRSGRDHLEREHVDHGMDPSTPKKDQACSSFPCPVDVAHCRASGKKGRPSLRQKRAKWSVGARSSTCVGAGEARSPTCLVARCPLVPAQPPGPGVCVRDDSRT